MSKNANFPSPRLCWNFSTKILIFGVTVPTSLFVVDYLMRMVGWLVGV